MSTYGILLPCDGTEPMPVSVGDLADIQAKVGGYIDAVSTRFNPSDFELEGEAFDCVGYVNDEGILLDMPVNGMASIMFQREVFGPVVVVSATSKDGINDGENYDVPEWFMDAVFQGGLFDLAQAMKATAIVQAEAVRLAFRDGIISADQFEQLVRMMESGADEYLDKIETIVNLCMMYATARSVGAVDKFDRAEYERSTTLSDEEIANFWEEEGNK